MRVMQIVSGRHASGAARQCLALCHALADDGHDVTLVCRPGSWAAEQAVRAPVLPLLSDLRRWPGELRRVAQLGRNQGVQVIHTHMTRANTFGLLVRSLLRTPSVATAHSTHWQVHWRFCDRVLANSEATRRFHRRWNGVRADRIEVVPCLIDLDRFAAPAISAARELRASWGLSDKHRVAGVIGDVHPRKGQWHAVRAWPRVLSELTTARLAIIGNRSHAPDYVRRLRREADRLGVGSSIVWVDEREDMPAVYAALDLCVSTSLEEPFGLTVPEAMAAGRAVVASRVGGLPENVCPGETGLLVPPARPAPLAAAVARLLADDELRAEFGARARRRVAERFSRSVSVARTVALYQDAIAHRPPQTAVPPRLPVLSSFSWSR